MATGATTTTTQLVVSFRQTGLLWMGKKSENELKSAAKVMKQYNLPYELLSSTEMTKRYPQLKFTPDWMALYDPEATLIYANRCLNAFQVLLEDQL